jgi:hypothetical protein
MKLTIIKDDGAVYKDGKNYLNLNLNSIPSDVHALQWNNDNGHIEYVEGTDHVLNEKITELPSWVNDALIEWQTAHDAQKIKDAERQALEAQMEAQQKAKAI